MTAGDLDTLSALLALLEATSAVARFCIGIINNNATRERVEVALAATDACLRNVECEPQLWRDGVARMRLVSLLRDAESEFIKSDDVELEAAVKSMADGASMVAHRIWERVGA